MDTSSLRSLDLFRNAALHGVNEAPFLDIHATGTSFSVKQIAIPASFITLGLAVVALFCLVPLPITFKAAATTTWQPDLFPVSIPTPGVIDSVNVSINDAVTKGTALGVVATRDTLHLRIDLDRRIGLLDSQIDNLATASALLSQSEAEISNFAAAYDNANKNLTGLYSETDQVYAILSTLKAKLSGATSSTYSKGLETLRTFLTDQIDNYQSKITATSSQIQSSEAKLADTDRRVTIASLTLDLRRANQDIIARKSSLILKRADLLGPTGNKLRSPVSGTIVSIPPAIGFETSAGEALFWIRASDATPVIEAVVPNEIAAQLQVSDHVTLRFPKGFQPEQGTAVIKSMPIGRPDNGSRKIYLQPSPDTTANWGGSDRLPTTVFFTLRKLRGIDMLLGTFR
ncbi:hypothetical protein [Rhizobium rhizogenes]|uniref:hypothetical protein n=1 Tax=Rhizobium rhizogenes TaxID=359 RepID=UPI001574C661|nr:hypothetical protein [Rhizobium rhizogenes]NTF98073.1 hypothetical protein [Rhizobium rhizogenes]